MCVHMECTGTDTINYRVVQTTDITIKTCTVNITINNTNKTPSLYRYSLNQFTVHVYTGIIKGWNQINNK